jgi:hypothetical protein
MMTAFMCALIAGSAGIAIYCDVVINTMGRGTPFLCRLSYVILAASCAFNAIFILFYWRIESHFFLFVVPLILVSIVERRKEVRTHAH